MVTAKLSSKGQIVLPKAVREAHGWREGDEFAVEETPDGVLLRPIRKIPSTDLDEVFGCVGYTGPPKTLEQMDAGIISLVGGRS